MTLLDARGVTIATPSGRVLVCDLSLSLGAEKVALIGRNGVGKTTLLETLAGLRKPQKGQVTFRKPPHLVSQLQKAAEMSPGEFRMQRLLAARQADAEMLLLDEPTQDLDGDGVAWLRAWLASHPGGLLVVSHDPRLLRDFEHFVVLSESGGRYFRGTLEQLEGQLEKEQASHQAVYLSRLHQMVEHAEHTECAARRRARKKRYGRVREMDRATPRAVLNQKRDAAQDNHGRDHRARQVRLEKVREWALAGRRALKVELPLVLPSRPGAEGVRLGVIGPNGAGKTTLLNRMLGEADPVRTGSIAQGGSDWRLDESLLAFASPEALVAHKFPLALADRPLRTLSPGERFRAALICLFQRSPAVELLVLDEPTYSLDLLGRKALCEALKAWRGGLLVASHDLEFLQAIEVLEWVDLGPPRSLHLM